MDKEFHLWLFGLLALVAVSGIFLSLHNPSPTGAFTGIPDFSSITGFAPITQQELPDNAILDDGTLGITIGRDNKTVQENVPTATGYENKINYSVRTPINPLDNLSLYIAPPNEGRRMLWKSVFIYNFFDNVWEEIDISAGIPLEMLNVAGRVIPTEFINTSNLGPQSTDPESIPREVLTEDSLLSERIKQNIITGMKILNTNPELTHNHLHIEISPGEFSNRHKRVYFNNQGEILIAMYYCDEIKPLAQYNCNNGKWIVKALLFTYPPM